MRSFWSWLITGDPVEPRESAWAWKEIQKRAAAEADLPGPRWTFKRPNPKKTAVTPFECRVLRMRRRA